MYYYHLDQLNTPRFVTNNKAEVVWENQADVYGYEEPETESDFHKASSFTQPIRFQGQYLDEESGLHYNRYRYYSPKQQRFINQDPIGLVGGINHYQYAPNPVNWVDPMGLLCKEGQAKVKAALDAKPEVSGDLRSQIENICKQEQSGCTADEMVEQINAFDAVTGGLDLFVSGLLNSVVDVVAGGAGIVTLAMSGGDVDAAVHTIESVQSNQIGPFTDAGQAVSEKLAPIVQEYYEDNMAALGDATLEATGSPALATMAHKSVEIAATLAGGKTVLNGAKGAKTGLKTPKASVYKFDDLESFNRAANKPKPKSTYLYGDHTWKTDDKGRVIEATGKVKLQKADGRAGTDGVSTVLIGKEGKTGDIGFHLIGDQFDGPTNRLNVVPGNGKRIDPNLPPNLNQGAYAKFERKVKEVRLDPNNDGKDIEIKIKPRYSKSNQTNRPDDFIASYKVAGEKPIKYKFKNQQGG